MKHIYIVNESSIASSYGIGTYIAHVINSLRDTAFQITVIDIYRSFQEFSIVWKDDVKHIQIPLPPAPDCLSSTTYRERTAENIALILYPYIMQTEQNIFHLNFTKDYHIAKSLKKYYKCKIVLTVHCSEWSFQLLGDKQKLFEMLKMKDRKNSKIIQTMKFERKLMTEVVDNIIAVAYHSYNDLINIYHVPIDKITIIPNAVCDKFEPISKTESIQIRNRLFFTEENLIVFAGRLAYIKGIDYLIKAYKIVLAKLPNSRLIIAGDGTIDKDLHKLAFPCRSKITFTGFISQDQLYRLFSIADVGVLPSLHEEFGLVAIEMMMCKLPIIVNNTTGLSELVENGVDGLKFTINPQAAYKRESIYKIAYQIIDLLQNKSLRNNIAINARNKYLKKYSLPRFKKQLTNFYENLYQKADR